MACRSAIKKLAVLSEYFNIYESMFLMACHSQAEDGLNLSKKEISDIIAFMKTLTDPAVIKHD